MSNSIFNNNANSDLELTPVMLSHPAADDAVARSEASVDNVTGVYDAIIYLGEPCQIQNRAAYDLNSLTRTSGPGSASDSNSDTLFLLTIQHNETEV